MTQLASQRCEACTPETPRLSDAESGTLQAQLSPEWSVVDSSRLEGHLRFKTFAAAFERASAVAQLAEDEGHHPDMCVGWGHLDITLTTHAIGGLSRNDFILAAKIDSLDER